MKKYLISDLWMILLLCIITWTLWLNVRNIKELSIIIVEQSKTIETLSKEVSQLGKFWEAPSGRSSWEIPKADLQQNNRGRKGK